MKLTIGLRTGAGDIVYWLNCVAVQSQIMPPRLSRSPFIFLAIIKSNSLRSIMLLKWLFNLACWKGASEQQAGGECLILVNSAQTLFLFSVDFDALMNFQPTMHCSQNFVDFWPLSMPFCAKQANMPFWVAVPANRVVTSFWAIPSTFWWHSASPLPHCPFWPVFTPFQLSNCVSQCKSSEPYRWAFLH